MVLLTMQMMLRLLAEMSAWHLQKIFRALRHMTQVIASYTISDSAEAILNAPETSIDKGVTVIDVDGPVEAGVGVQLGEFASGIQAVTGFSSDVQFDVEDSASDIAQALMSDPTDAMNLADSLVATSGVVSVDSAADIQGVTGYDASGSSYTVSDTAGAILGDTATVIDDGVSHINVAGPVGAGVGVQLGVLEDASFETGYSADINFNVVDDANDITAALSGDTTGAMDNAASMIVSGGTATVTDAADIQGVAEYDSGASSYTITDSADAVLTASNESTILNDGVSGVVVTDATGAGYVDASDGEALSELEGLLQTATNDSAADIEFRVEDDAAAIAAVLNGDRDALDGANDLDVTGGTTTVAGAADIQSSGAYDAANSDYTITDTAGAILGDTATAIDDGVSTINVDGPVGAGVGVQLGALEDGLQLESGMNSDIIFDVEDSASNIVANADGLDEARNVKVYDTVNNYVSDASMSDAATIEGINNSGLTTYNILDTAQNLYDLEITSQQVQDYMEAVTGFGESVTYAQLAQYVEMVPDTSLTNLASNANNYTESDIAAYKAAIPTDAADFDTVQAYISK